MSRAPLAQPARFVQEALGVGVGGPRHVPLRRGQLRRRHDVAAKAGAAAVSDILARIEAHLAAHDGYVAFSGGKESLVVLHFARRVNPDVPVVFFDSGFDYPDTCDYLTHLAQTWRLDLHRIPTDPRLLDVLVASGLWNHTASTDTAAARVDLHEVLITAPARRDHALLGAGELWGVRADESAARPTFTPAAAAATGSSPARSRVRTDLKLDLPTMSGRILPDTGCRSTRSTPKLRELGVPDSQQRISHLIDGDHLDRGRLTWLRRGWPALFKQLAGALPRIRQLA